MVAVFLSYRREDSTELCRRLYAELVPHLGRRNVFLDVDTVPVGVDFPTYIEESVRQMDVMLVVIGPRWLDARGEFGRRLDDPQDFVRKEIELALQHNKVIFPLLVGTTIMPGRSEMPPSIASLATRQALRLSAPLDAGTDVPRILRAVREAADAIEVDEQLHGPAVALAQVVERCLTLTGATVLAPVEPGPPGEALLTVRFAGDGAAPIRVLCTSDEADVSTVDRLDHELAGRAMSRGWLVAESRVDELAAEHAAGPGRIEVFSLASLLHRLLRFDAYVAWLEAGYAQRDIGELYTELAFTKPSYDAHGSEVGQSFHPSLTSYVDSWLYDNSKSHLSVLGDFGSGKTWSCWYYAYRQLRRYQANPGRERIPILLQLRDYLAFTTTDAILGEFGRTFGLPDSAAPLLRELNQQGRLLVICDGFDELRPDDRLASHHEAFARLAEFAQPRSKVILTCRKQYFHDNVEERQVLASPRPIEFDVRQHPRFAIIYLSDLSARQVQDVLRKRLGPEWPAYWSKIQVTYDLPNLVHRPVMLSMVIDTLEDLVTRSRVTVVDLYRAYTDRWIQQIGANRSRLPSEVRLALMEALAWHMFLTGRLEVHYSALPALARQAELPLAGEWSDYDQDIRSQAFLVRNATGDYYFAHKSFMEFFVAEKLCAALRTGDPAPLRDRTLPPEIVRFMVEIGLVAPQVYGYLAVARAEPAPDYLAGNLLSLLRALGFDLRRRDFSRLQIRNANLAGADLHGGDFRESTLTWVNLTDADVRHADFTGAVMDNLILGVRSAAKTVACRPDGALVATAAGDNAVELLDAESLAPYGRVVGPKDSITSTTFSPDNRLVAAGSFDGTATVWDVEHPARPATVLTGHAGTVYDVAFTHDSRYLVTAGNDKRLKVWSVADAAEVLTLEGHDATVYSVGVHRYSHLIASGSFDSTVGLWNLSINRAGVTVSGFHQLRGHEGLVNHIAWSPDCGQLASASNDGTVIVWRVSTEEPMTVLRGHTDTVWSVGFSPDGAYAASGSSDTTIRVWDLSTGATVTTLRGHESEVWELAFHPALPYLYSSSFDGTVRMWDWRQGTEVTAAFLAVDGNQKMRCDGMRITGTTGLSTLQRRFLVQRGAVQAPGSPRRRSVRELLRSVLNLRRGC